MIETTTTAERELEELTRFVYLMPVAVARFGAAGELEMLNPKAVGFLHELDIDPCRTDLVSVLDRLAPGISQMWRASAGSAGAVMPALQCTPPQAVGPALHFVISLVRTDKRCTMLTVNDVTVMVEQERELDRQRRRVGVMLAHIHGYCVLMLDIAGMVSEWNPSMRQVFGLDADSIVGRPLLSLVHATAGGAPAPDFAHVLHTVASQGWCQLDAPWQRSDQQVIWGDCVIAPVLEPDGTASGFVAVIRDITDEHKHTLNLIDAAMTDPLTRLFNRRGLDEQADAIVGTRGAGALLQSWIMVDIDHFKGVNDDYGHEAGDEVLKTVAQALRVTARDADIVARFGGEEFVLLLPGATAEVAGRVAERLRRKIQDLSTQIGGTAIRVTASFGVAQQMRDEHRNSVLHRADEALYTSKREGRNRVTLCASAQGDAASEDGTATPTDSTRSTRAA